MNNFDKTIRDLHQILGDKINNCYIVNCHESAIIALRGKESGEIHFYCKRCAEALLTGISFVVVERV